jgi:hypothetical protein
MNKGKPYRKSIKPKTDITVDFCDEFHQAATKVSIESLRAGNHVKFIRLTEDIKVSNPLTDETSLERGIANARLSGLRGSPELDAISRDFSFGKISLDEAFEAAAITRRIEFKIQVLLPTKITEDDALSFLTPTCSDAVCVIVLPNQITLSFERQGIVRDEIVEGAINDILDAIPEGEILEVHS